MKAIGFVQIEPIRDSEGRAHDLRVQRVTQSHPRDPIPGAMVVRIVLDIPDVLANAQTVEAAVEAGAITITVPVLAEDFAGAEA